MVKTLQLQSTFGSWGVEKVHALWREAHSEVKMRKTRQLWNTFRSWEVYKKVHGIAAWSACRNQNAKITTCSDHFWTFNSHFVCVAGTMEFAPRQNWAKGEGFEAVSKAVANVGCLNGTCKDVCSVAGAGAGQETSPSDMSRGPGANFLSEVWFWSIRPAGFLRWF